jgi:hypothetical protein
MSTTTCRPCTVSGGVARPTILACDYTGHAGVQQDGSRRVERVSLTEGGVYDNLGLAPLWPDREASVEALDTIICCRAGYRLRHDPPNQFTRGAFDGARLKLWIDGYGHALTAKVFWWFRGGSSYEASTYKSPRYQEI